MYVNFSHTYTGRHGAADALPVATRFRFENKRLSCSRTNVRHRSDRAVFAIRWDRRETRSRENLNKNTAN